ncbi:MAG: carbohydrate kinase family protein [bacterium]|nr:carbohydrate kinase family protein [bacterium]
MSFVTGVGTINCDLLYSGLTGIPNEGEEVFSKAFAVQLGGGLPAIMVNLARLGLPVQFCTFLGTDMFSASMQDILEDKKIRFKNLYHGSGIPICVTAVAITRADRTFLSYQGEICLKDGDIEEIYAYSKGAKIVKMYYEEGNRELLRLYAKLKQEGAILTMDTGWEEDLSLQKYHEYLQLADFYTPNEKEAKKITGTDSVEAAAERLAEYFDEVIIKLGKDGCFYQNREGRKCFAPMQGIRAVDATGAGDAFLAGFMYGLYYGYSTEDCIRLGNVTGGYCVQAVGCLSSFPTEEELLEQAGVNLYVPD